MKRAVVALALVAVLLLAVGLPLPVGAGMISFCPECPPTDLRTGVGLCFALLVIVGLILPPFRLALAARTVSARGAVLVSRLERPPRSA